MKKSLICLFALTLVSCVGGATDAPVSTATATLPNVEEATRVEPAEIPTEPAPEEPVEESSTAEPAAEAVRELPELVVYAGAPLPTDRQELFSGSGACTACHDRMVDKAGNDVSIGEFWRSTMMANAARDPYWQATVQSEMEKLPALAEVIEDKCATCHTPMARYQSVAAGGQGELFDDGVLNPAHELHAVGMDGVSCTLCHQIEHREAHSGGYVLGDQPAGERVTYGPFSVDEAGTALMQAGSGFIPVMSRHIQRPVICAACHTLYTPYVDGDGEIAGEFPEQTPVLEWHESDYAGRQFCQSCHMPHADGGVVLSLTGGEPREPFSQHYFVGGNAYMLDILKYFGEERGVTASTAQFDDTIGRVREQLKSKTATMALENVQISEGVLTTDVAIASMAGHKFPTGFPSRRAWLHVIVTDGAGNLVFESGAVRADGSIAGNDNDSDPSAFEPHYTTITSADQVQIYEPIMVNTDGDVTTTLLRSAAYVKDNRLLPAGFNKAAAPADVAIYGAAFEDADFDGGGDRVRYEIDLGSASGPFSVNVELLYQTVGYRWASNLGEIEGEQIARFQAYYQAIPNTPVTVAAVTVEVD